MQDDQDKPLLGRIHTGMTVFDREGEELGTVDGVFLGPPRPLGEAPGPATEVADEPAGQASEAGDMPPAQVAADPPAAGPMIDSLQDFPIPPGTPHPVAASDEDVEETLRSSGMRAGYIRVANQELSDAQRLIAAQDIERIDEWRVVLRVTRADLAER